jgi:nickel/cobalt transporter (NicO) family protein
MHAALILAHLEPASWFPVLSESAPTLGTAILGTAIAFGLGAVHALSPGHGKTMISAYLVGARGTPQHALLLGLITTITHTLTVFLLGLGALFASQYILPEQLYPVLSVASGLMVCAVGIGLLRHRLRSPLLASCSHAHLHSHEPVAGHAHESVASEHQSHIHDHSHAVALPPKVSLSSLVGLGIAGGLVPCPSALVLLLSAIALHQTAYGLFLVSGFSVGMASVLVVVGLLVLYAKQWVDRFVAPEQLGRQLSIASAIVIIGAGVGLTVFSIG